MISYGLGWTLNPVKIIRDRREIQGRRNVKMGAEITVTDLQSKESQELLAATRCWGKGIKWFLPQSFQKGPTLMIL